MDARSGRSPSSQQFWRSWSPAPDAGAGIVVLVHGLHEHSGRYAHVAERLGRAGYATWAPDHHGHGRSPGEPGNVGSMAAMVGGVDEVARLAAESRPGLPVFVYGHSMGGLVAAQYLAGTPSVPVAGAVLSAAAIEPDKTSRLEKAVLPLLSRMAPNLGVTRLDPTAVSRDPAVVADYQVDPLNRMGPMRARTAAEMVATAVALLDRLGSVVVPLLLLHGTADRLVSPAASELIAARAGSRDITHTVYDGLFHEPHNEPERDQVLDDVVAWLDAHR